MIRALESLGPDSPHLEFFGLARPPFVRLSETSEIFHTEQHSLLMAHLASATEQPDCLLVICGANGSGKTTLLNHYITSLSDDISYASIDETCKGEKPFYCALLRQLGFNGINGTPGELRRIAKEFLIHRGMAGDHVLILIDNAHLIHPTVLEQLRWISALKVKDRRVLSIVLSGNSDLARIMDSPAMCQTKFHSHVRFNIRAYTEDEIGAYISHRLKSTGGTDAITFSNEVLPFIYRYTGGIPSMINMLCNAVLAEAHAQNSRDISEELVRAVADNRRLSPHVIPLQGKGRRKSDPDFKFLRSEQTTDEGIAARDVASNEPVEIPTPGSDTSDVDATDLLAQITQLSVELGELRASRMRALQDISMRDVEIGRVHKKLNVQSAKTEKLASTLEGRTDEIERLNLELLSGKIALEKNEKTSIKLASDLQKARGAKKAAQTDSASAKAKAEALAHLTSELQATVSGLTVDLKLTDKQVLEIDALEKDTAALTDDIEKKAGQLLTIQSELDSRDEALVDLKMLFEDSENECATLRFRATELENLEETVLENNAHIAVLKSELTSCNEEIKALEAKNVKTEESSAPKPDPTSIITTLEVVDGDNIQQVMALTENHSRIMIGRADDSDLRLNSGFVSRHHALIFCTAQGLYIEDLNSFNGTIVNSRKTARCDLKTGDIVEIGEYRITPR